ncbi:MAG TPA: hypothetical protein VEA58_14135 [Anaerovoracaceae bacterium]|nr:hypothetical protein [Anaerovoracaceae bacterium]
MKKLIMIFITVLAVMSVLAACSPDTGNGNDNAPEPNNPLKDLKSYIEQAENPTEVKEYLDGLMEGSDEKTSDSLIFEYLNYMNGIVSGNVTYEKEILESAGFKLISVEGNEQPIIDYHFIDDYSGQISQEMIDFAEFMTLNSDKPWAMDAGIIIPLTDLADRIALGEQFIVKYPSSIMKEQVQILYGYYLRSFIGGLDNTPLILFDTKKIDPEFITAFDYFLETYPDLKTAETVETLQAELKATDYTAPYTYGDEEKRTAFQKHIDELVANAENRLNQ